MATPALQTRDIETTPINTLSWAPNDALNSLESIRAFVEKQAQSAISWYWAKKRSKALASRYLRILTIGFATIGGLIPLVTGLSFLSKPEWGLDKWGYVALGISAATVGIDKFFGFSSGWVRYVSTAQSIQEDLYGFQIDWARAMSKLGGAAPTSVQLDEMLQCAKEFSSRVTKQVSQETQQWIVEFQSSLTDIEKTTNARLEAARPGSLTVNVDNVTASDQPITISVDGNNYGTLTGTSWSIRQIPPGPHTIVVSGQKSGKNLQQSGIAVVSPGTVAKLDLHLPA